MTFLAVCRTIGLRLIRRLAGGSPVANATAGGTVEKPLFGITCTTCRARLAVRSENIVGTIVECPRCQSMVYVDPPPEWLEANRAAKEIAAAEAKATLAPATAESVVTGSTGVETANAESAANAPVSPGVRSPTHWLIAQKWVALTGVLMVGAVLLMAALAAMIAWRVTKSWSSSSEATISSAEASSSAEAASPAAPADNAAADPAAAKPAAAEVAPAVDATKKPTAANAVAAAAGKEPAEKTAEKGTAEKAADGEAAKSPSKPPESKPPENAKPEPTQAGVPKSYAAAKPLVKDSDAYIKPGAESSVALSASGPKQPPPAAKPGSSPSEKKGTAAAKPDPFGPMANEVAESSARTPAAEIKKLAPAEVNVTARLADRIPEITMTGLPLSKACDLVAAIGCLPITLDVDAMSELGVSPRDPVSLQLTSTTVGQVLQAIAEKHRLVPSVEAGQVLVTSPAEYRETLRRVRYTVSDVTGDGATPTGELAGIVRRRLVAPESWQVNGGRGAVEPDGAALVVIQSGDVHQQVLDFCEKLRLARHKPLRSRGDHERFSLSSAPSGPTSS